MKLNLKKSNGVAMVTVTILVFLLTMLAAVMLSLLANQGRFIEHDVRRIKARYAAEAKMVRDLEYLRKGATLPADLSINDLIVESNINGDELNLTVEYSPTF